MILVTLSKIAQLAHVSVSTASKAFSMSKEVNEHTRKEIFEIAKQLGCFKKYYNPKYPKWVIAIITPEFSGRYYTSIITQLEKLLSKRNCEICVATTNFSAEKEEELLRYYDEYSSVDGIISLANSSDYKAINLPVVYYKYNNKTASKGILDALIYLKSNGLTKIGFIGEALTNTKYEMFCKCMSELSINVNAEFISITEGRFEKGGYLAADNLIKNNSVPEALICAYDYLAIGAIKCLQDNNIKVPQDVKIIGFNNIPETAYLQTPLATIDSHQEIECKAITEKLFSILDGVEHEEADAVSSEFILRESAMIK